MGDQDARPPPGVCNRAAHVLGNTADSRDLREYAEKHPDDFAWLLHHAGRCSSCQELIDQAFPEGFGSEEDQKFVREGVGRAEQLLEREQAERALVQRTPEEGNASTEPRGGG